MFWLNETFFCFFGVNDQVQTNWRVLVCTNIHKKCTVLTDFKKDEKKLQMYVKKMSFVCNMKNAISSSL